MRYVTTEKGQNLAQIWVITRTSGIPPRGLARSDAWKKEKKGRKKEFDMGSELFSRHV